MESVGLRHKFPGAFNIFGESDFDIGIRVIEADYFKSCGLHNGSVVGEAGILRIGIVCVYKLFCLENLWRFHGHESGSGGSTGNNFILIDLFNGIGNFFAGYDA